MNYWRVLGIKPTKDKMAIKEAYMEKLSYINPEDDEEGFKELRQAYETLLKECDEEAPEDNSPAAVWLRKVEDVYKSFSKRLDENAWKELLQDEVCYGLDTKEDASLKLLTFLMDNCYMPQKIWVTLNQCFDWIDNKPDLYERFPEGFVDYVENRVNYQDNLNYDLFEDIDDDKDYDEWIALYFKIRRELNEDNAEEAFKDLNKIYDLDISHPYLEVLKIRYLTSKKDTIEEAEKIGEQLYEKFNNDSNVVYALAEIKWLECSYEEAEKLYNEVLQMRPDDYNALLGIADCDFKMEKYEEAKDLYNDLYRRNTYDNYVRNQMMNVNDKLIERYKEEDKHDAESIFKTAWCLFENYRYDEIIELTEGMTVEEEDMNQYCDLLGRTYAGLDEYEKAIHYFKTWSNKIEKVEDKDEDAYYNLNYLYSNIGNQYRDLEKYDEALKYYDKALEINEDDVDVLNAKGKVLLLAGKYDESLKVLDRALEIDDNYYSVYVNKSKALFELGYDGDALDDAIKAQNVYPYNPECYVLQMKLYCKHGESDNALEVYNTAESYSAVSDKVTLYKIIALQDKKQFEEAKDCAIELIKRIKKDGDYDEILDELYYQLSLIYSDMGNNEQALKYVQEAMKISKVIKYYYARAYYYKYKKDFDNALSDYNYCIDKFPEDTFAYVREAEIYKAMKDFEKSIALYKKVLEINDHHEFANHEIAEIYNQKGDLITALPYYTRQLEVNKTAYCLVSRGIAYDRLMRYDEALKDYQEAMELEPENPHPYNNAGIVYMEKNDFETAIKYLKKAIENMGDEPYKYFFKNIGRSYTKLKKYDEAIKYYDEGLKYFSDELDLYEKKAGVYRLMEKYQDAVNVYMDCMNIEGIDLEDLYDDIGSIYEDNIKDYDEALKWFEKTIKLNPDHPYEYRKIGTVYYNKKDYDTAIKYYKKQLTIDKYAYTYVKLAEAYKDKKDKTNASENYKIALELYKKVRYPDASHYTEMAGCYKELGQLEEAVDFCNKSMCNMCSDCDYNECNDAYYILGEIAEKSKDYEKALEYYNKVLEISGSDEDAEEGIARIKKILG